MEDSTNTQEQGGFWSGVGNGILGGAKMLGKLGASAGATAGQALGTTAKLAGGIGNMLGRIGDSAGQGSKWGQLSEGSQNLQQGSNWLSELGQGIQDYSHQFGNDYGYGSPDFGALQQKAQEAAPKIREGIMDGVQKMGESIEGMGNQQGQPEQQPTSFFGGRAPNIARNAIRGVNWQS